MKASKCAKLSTAGDVTCVGGLKMLWNWCCCIDDCMPTGCCAMMKGVGCAPAISGGAMFIMPFCCAVTEGIDICVLCIGCGRLIAVVFDEVRNKKSKSLFTAATKTKQYNTVQRPTARVCLVHVAVSEDRLRFEVLLRQSSTHCHVNAKI